MPSEPIPKFDGKASTFATFIMEFVGYAILQIDGVKYLHALEQNHEPNSWYTMKTHVGTGTNYHYEETDEFSTTYEEQVGDATCPAYPLATTQAERKEARAKDKQSGDKFSKLVRQNKEGQKQTTRQPAQGPKQQQQTAKTSQGPRGNAPAA